MKKKNPSSSKRIKRLLTCLSARSDKSKTPALLSLETEMTEEEVENGITEARLRGHLIVQNATGYFLAQSYAVFNKWRRDYVVVELVYTLDMLRAMGMSAKQKFDREHDPDSIFPIETG